MVSDYQLIEAALKSDVPTIQVGALTLSPGFSLRAGTRLTKYGPFVVASLVFTAQPTATGYVKAATFPAGFKPVARGGVRSHIGKLWIWDETRLSVLEPTGVTDDRILLVYSTE